MDVYYLNAYNDLMDVIGHAGDAPRPASAPDSRPEKCSAFLKRSSGKA